MGKKVTKTLGNVLGINAASSMKPDRAAQRRAEEQANLARNQQADLTLDNVAQVEAGGTADELESGAQRRRRTGSSVASSLGINV